MFIAVSFAVNASESLEDCFYSDSAACSRCPKLFVWQLTAITTIVGTL